MKECKQGGAARVTAVDNYLTKITISTNLRDQLQYMYTYKANNRNLEFDFQKFFNCHGRSR